MNAPAPWLGVNVVADSVPVGGPALIMRTASDTVQPMWFGGAIRSRIVMRSNLSLLLISPKAGTEVSALM
jgi:hypothetical protein